ncbi:MAG: hypothetical protein II036_06585, partial [Oscillospiraceae bacterium]|nr:hypothetical protein [Oscillospiraceae bacterium]
ETDEVEIPNYTGTVYKVVPDEGTEPEPEPDPESDYVAQIVRTGKKYSTLDAALSAAADGDTIELIADAAFYSSLSISDKELTIEGGEYEILIPNRDARLYLYSGTKLTINGGDWYFASYNMWGDYFITAYSGAELTVNSGSWYLNSGEIALFRADNGSKLTINGGEYDLYSTSSRYAIYSYSQNPEDVVVNGGYFENCHFYASSNNGSRGWEIKGGKFGENVTFENGYLSGGYYALDPSYINQYTRPGYKAVHAPEDVTIPYYFDAVYSVAKVDDDTVTAGVAVNLRTGIEYESLNDALTSAESGDTVMLLANAALDSWVGLYDNITLDLDGHTVTSTDYISLYSGSVLTLKGGNWISDRYYTVFSINSGAKVTVESGSFTNTTNNSSSLFGLYGGELEIKGGAFNWNYGQMIYAQDNNSNKLTISGGDFTNLYSSSDSSSRCLIYWNSSSGTNTKSEITGGTFRRGYLNIYNSKLSITGGEFLGEISLNGNSGYIKGGLWAFEPNSGYIYSGYKAEVSDKTIAGYSGTVYEIVTGEELEPVAKDKDTGEVYYTLVDALTSAPNGAKLELLRDTRIANNNIVMSGNSVSLDLKDYSVNNDGYLIYIQNGARLTLEGGHWLRRSNYLFQIEYGTLYIKSGEFKNEDGYSHSDYLIYSNSSSGKLVITGGTFEQSVSGWNLIYVYSDNDYASAITGGEFRKGYIYYGNSSYSGFSILGGVFSP